MTSTNGEVQIAAVGISEERYFVQTPEEKQQAKKKGKKRSCTNATDCVTQNPSEEFLHFLQST